MYPRVETVETNFFDSVEEFSRSFFCSFGIELNGKFMGIEGSLSASMQKSMSQEGTGAKAVLTLRIYKRGRCYQMRRSEGGSRGPARGRRRLTPCHGAVGGAIHQALWYPRQPRLRARRASVGDGHGQFKRARRGELPAQRPQGRHLHGVGRSDRGSFGVSAENEDEINRRMQSVSVSTRCSSAGGDPDAESPCISQEEFGTDSNAKEVERRLANFFTPNDLATGQSALSLHLKDMADIFSHMGYHNHSHAMRKDKEFYMCKFLPRFKWVQKENAEDAEHSCQCDLQCKNGGIVDPESCTCQCPRDSFHGWSGADCSEVFGLCQIGANSGNQAAARQCAVNNVCASALWKSYGHSTQVCCLTHLKGKCCL